MGFYDLVWEDHRIITEMREAGYDAGGMGHATHYFPNGYGVSVVQFWYDLSTGRLGIDRNPYSISGSYGADRGLYELAVLKKGEGIVYDTPIANDVLGNLTSHDVTRIMGEVEKLSAISPELMQAYLLA